MASTWFNDIDVAKPIEVFALSQACNEDPFPQKVNLTIGAYRTDECKPWVLPVVRDVEAQMAADQTLNHEYLPVAGNPDYRSAAVKLLLGEDSPAVNQKRCDGIQAVGGTGALRIGFDFCKSRLKSDDLYVSDPTWGNHIGIANSLGYKNVKKYRYWNDAMRKLDFDGFKEDISGAPKGSVIVLHMAAHNPTGMDPTQEEWAELCKIIKEKDLFPFFDCAYQGFSSGDLEKDAWPVRYFVDQGMEFFAAQSFSKNFGLYNERVGNLVFVVNDPNKLLNVRSQLMTVVRQTWSNSPNHGSRIVSTVLNNVALRDDWKSNVKTMAERILQMRSQLYEKLRALGTPGDWSHVVKQTGMFSYLGLNPRQCEHLMDQYHVYLLKSGRINMCGVTTKNVDYIAQAIHDAVTTVKDDPKL